MDIKEYSKEVENNRSIMGSQLEDNLHMVLGMVTETGELADTFKKLMAYGKEVDWVNVKEELGDLMWYVIGFCNINGFDFYDVLNTNAKKLNARYKNGFTPEEAEQRNLEAERKILEGSSIMQLVPGYMADWWLNPVVAYTGGAENLEHKPEIKQDGEM